MCQSLFGARAALATVWVLLPRFHGVAAHVDQRLMRFCSSWLFGRIFGLVHLLVESVDFPLDPQNLFHFSQGNQPQPGFSLRAKKTNAAGAPGGRRVREGHLQPAQGQASASLSFPHAANTLGERPKMVQNNMNLSRKYAQN